VLLSGEEPTQANVPTFVANVLHQEYGRWLLYIVLFVGFLILFDTQLGIYEALVRNTTDAANMSPRLQQAIAGDPRRFYYPFMLVLIAIIAVVLHFLPARPADPDLGEHVELRRPHLPVHVDVHELQAAEAARPKGWVYLILVLNFLFFGFFFLNFVWNEVTGDALVQF
jgi:hypothetical protein